MELEKDLVFYPGLAWDEHHSGVLVSSSTSYEGTPQAAMAWDEHHAGVLVSLASPVMSSSSKVRSGSEPTREVDLDGERDVERVSEGSRSARLSLRVRSKSTREATRCLPPKTPLVEPASYSAPVLEEGSVTSARAA